MLINIPIANNEDIKDEPPAETKGNGTPVIGINLIMPPIFRKVCTLSQAIIPTAIAPLKISGLFFAIKRPL